MLRCGRRQFSSSTLPPSTEVFDRHLKRAQRTAAATDADADALVMGVLKDTVARNLVDRLEDITRDFPRALDLGCGRGHVAAALREAEGAGGIESLVECDMSKGMVLEARRRGLAAGASHPLQTSQVVCDEEFLPFQNGSFDLVFSSLSMHWVNDLPGMLRQARAALVPDGAFMGAMLGGKTLDELRTCLMLAEQEREGGVSPAVSPMAQLSDAAGLISGAGFRLPVVDEETYAVPFESALHLMEELQRSGEQSAVPTRRSAMPRETLLAAASIYDALYGLPDGRVEASFQVIYMIGWSPDDSQPRPKRRGSATVSLKDALGS